MKLSFFLGGVMKHTAKDLADAIGAIVEGDGSTEVTGVAAPERASSSDLIFANATKHVSRAESSAAKCVVLPAGLSVAGKTVLRAENAKVAFAGAAALLREPSIIASGVHPTAVIAPLAKIAGSASIGPYAVIGEDAHIGEHTQIGAHCVIGAGSWIGDNCRIHPRVTLYANTRIGNRVEIHAGAVVGADGFGYVYGEGRHWKFPQAGIVEIGANTTIDRGSLDDTRIAEGVKIDNLVHVGHNVQIGAHTVIAAQTGISGSSSLGHHVLVGGQVGIGEHCALEDGAIAGGQAGILTGKTIRAGQTVWGTPAREIGKFKEEYAWYARLPELGARIKEIESKMPPTGKKKISLQRRQKLR